MQPQQQPRGERQESNKSLPGRDALIYEPSKVSWATAEFVRQPPALAARIFIYCLGAFLVIAPIYAYFSEVAVTINTQGRLVTEQAVFPVKATASFKVSKLLVEKNKVVKKGDLLLVAEDQLSDDEYRTFIQQTNQLSDLIQKDKSGGCKNCLGDMRGLAERLYRTNNKGNVREIISPIQEMLKELVTAESQLQNIGASIASLQRQIEVAQGKLAEIQRRKAQKLLAVQVEQLTNEISSARSQIADRRQNLGTNIVQIRNRLEVRLQGVKGQLDQYRNSNAIVSPIDGIVSELQASGVGQFIQAGQDVLLIIPAGSELVAELLVENKDISQVSPNMAAKIKLDALPERQYGSVNGTVVTVPPDISDPNNPQAPAGYKVLVKLDKQSLTKDGVEYPFRLGMSLTGLIVTRYESILTLGIKKLFNIKDSILKD